MNGHSNLTLMKKFMSIVCGLLSFGLLFSFESFGQNTTEKNWIISVHNLVLNNNVEKTAARRYLESEWFQMFKETPGMNAFLTELDRGNVK